MGHCIYFSTLAAKALNHGIFKIVCYSSVIYAMSVSSVICSMFVFRMKYVLPHLYFVHLPIRSHQYVAQASSFF